MFQRIHDGCLLFLGTATRFSGACVAVVVILMLTDAQLLTNLSDISGVNLEALLLSHILLYIIVGVDLASIGFQILCIHGDTQIVSDLFPT